MVWFIPPHLPFENRRARRVAERECILQQQNDTGFQGVNVKRKRFKLTQVHLLCCGKHKAGEEAHFTWAVGLINYWRFDEH
jgi:hypothetical protein